MFVVVVKFKITAGHSESFLERVLQQAADSLEKEPGCHVFDVCISGEDSHVIVLYEIYTNKSAFELHLQSDHFKSFDYEVKNIIEEKVVEQYQKLEVEEK